MGFCAAEGADPGMSLEATKATNAADTASATNFREVIMSYFWSGVLLPIKPRPASRVLEQLRRIIQIYRLDAGVEINRARALFLERIGAGFFHAAEGSL